MINDVTKKAIVSEIKEVMDKNFAGHRQNIEQSCLFWAIAGIYVVTEYYGFDCSMNCGSAHFRCNREDPILRMSYQFDKAEAAMLYLSGRFPEMHCWNVIHDRENMTNWVVDCTTGFQKRNQEIIGASQSETAPFHNFNYEQPEFFFAEVPQKISHDVPALYEADEDATLLGMQMFLEMPLDAIPFIPPFNYLLKKYISKYVKRLIDAFKLKGEQE